MENRREKRVELICQIEEERRSYVICYLTSLRPRVCGSLSDDAIRQLFDHLARIPHSPCDRLDLFLVSNGGDFAVPWRLVSLCREHAQEFNVLIPYRACSAASLIALGADKVVMHAFGQLGPTDPLVRSGFNPRDELGMERFISGEDVRAFARFVKETMGIKDPEGLNNALKVLAKEVHPLALGHVDRNLHQARLVAERLLRTHIQDVDDDTIASIVDTMASGLHHHSHPINRLEAEKDLGLKFIEKPSPVVEKVMWKLYKEYEEAFENRIPFDPAADLTGIRTDHQRDYDVLMAVIECQHQCSVCVQRVRCMVTEAEGARRITTSRLASVWRCLGD